MATTVQNNALSRALMLLCMGAGMLILGLGRQTSGLSKALPQPRPAPMSVSPVVATPGATAKLVVDLSDRRVYLYQQHTLKVSYPLAVGQAGWETPTGSFKVFQMMQNPSWQHPITKEVIPPGPDNPLGKSWIGFWADDKMLIGFHGTNQETLIGQAVSHGCLRMKNRDISALYRQVALGTVVEVRP
jgi:L,D-transpeptidase ErfK/SrfK